MGTASHMKDSNLRFSVITSAFFVYYENTNKLMWDSGAQMSGIRFTMNPGTADQNVYAVLPFTMSGYVPYWGVQHRDTLPYDFQMIIVVALSSTRAITIYAQWGGGPTEES